MTAHATSTDRARHAPTTWSRTLAALLSRVSSIGLDPDELARELELDARILREADGRLPLETLYALLEVAVARSGDELTPLVLARDLEPESFDALGLLVASSPDLGTALDHTIRYQRVFAEGERYELARCGDRVHVRYAPWGRTRAAHVAMADLFARDLAVNVASVTGAPIAGVVVRLRRDVPRDLDRFTALLGADAELGAPIDEVVFPRSAMELAIPRADPAVARFFERYLDERLARLPEGSPIARVAAAIEALLPEGAITLATLAQRMRTSPRTLQRRLAESGTSLTELVTQVRRARALALVEAGASFAEIAWTLGYSEPSAFHRAFRRWTGTTALAWREAHAP